MTTANQKALDYRSRLFAIQKAMGKTKSDLARVIGNSAIVMMGAAVLILFIVGTVTSGALFEFEKTMHDWGVSFENLGRTLGILLWPVVVFCIGFVLALPFLALYFFGKLVKDVFVFLTMKTKTFSCLGCNARYQVFRIVKEYVCPDCRLVMQFQYPDDLVRLECAHCHLGFAASKELHSINCVSCDTPQRVVAGVCEVDCETIRCPTCAFAMPASAKFCANCLSASQAYSPVDIPEKPGERCVLRRLMATHTAA